MERLRMNFIFILALLLGLTLSTGCFDDSSDDDEGVNNYKINATVNYSGSGTVDDTHKILIVCIDWFDEVDGGMPAMCTITSNGGSCELTEIKYEHVVLLITFNKDAAGIMGGLSVGDPWIVHDGANPKLVIADDPAANPTVITATEEGVNVTIDLDETHVMDQDDVDSIFSTSN